MSGARPEPFVTRERGRHLDSMHETFGPRLKKLKIAMEIKEHETIKTGGDRRAWA